MIAVLLIIMTAVILNLQVAGFYPSSVYRYGYESLDMEDRTTYEEIYDSILSGKTTMLTNTDKESAVKIYKTVIADHPEIFYTDGATYTRYVNSGRLSFEPHYSMSDEDIKKYQERIDEKTEEVLRYIPKDLTDYEKIETAYQYVCDNTDYDLTENGRNLLTAFLDGTGVCTGYAKTLQYLLQELHVPCGVVIGKVKKSDGTTEGHMWNYVRCDGEWYLLDPTWDDNEGLYRMSGYTGTSHCYFLLDELPYHTSDGSLPEPVYSTKSSYFTKKGLYIKTGSDSEIENAVKTNYLGFSSQIIEFKFADADTLDAFVKDQLDNGKFRKTVKAAGGEYYSYTVNRKRNMCAVVIYSDKASMNRAKLG